MQLSSILAVGGLLEKRAKEIIAVLCLFASTLTNKAYVSILIKTRRASVIYLLLHSDCAIKNETEISYGR